MEQEKLAFVLYGHEDSITALAVTEDGKCLLSGSRDATLRVWDLAGLLSRRRIRPRRLSGASRLTLRGQYGTVTCIMPAPDGRQAFSGSGDGTVRHGTWKAAGCCQS